MLEKPLLNKKKSLLLTLPHQLLTFFVFSRTGKQTRDLLIFRLCSHTILERLPTNCELEFGIFQYVILYLALVPKNTLILLSNGCNPAYVNGLV